MIMKDSPMSIMYVREPGSIYLTCKMLASLVSQWTEGLSSYMSSVTDWLMMGYVVYSPKAPGIFIFTRPEGINQKEEIKV